MRTAIELKEDELFWKNIDLLEEGTGLSSAFMAKELGLHPLKFQFHRNHQLIIPFNSVNNFSKSLGLSVEAFWKKDLTSHHFKEAIKINSKKKIPEQYKIGEGSRSFTVRHIMQVAKKYGIYEDVCEFFGLSDMCFSNTIDFNVSVQLASDILEFMAAKVDLTDQDFSDMSIANALYFRDSNFGRELSSSKDVIEMYDKFLNVVNQIEENWSYKIQYADKKMLLLNCYHREQMANEFKRKDYSSYTFTKFRVSMAAHLTKYLGLTDTIGTITKSIHYGDSYCQMKFDYSNARPLFS
ncbi:MAG: hypothetical protein AB7I27_02200 [Bacteriovoracaceae bacterium]